MTTGEESEIKTFRIEKDTNWILVFFLTIWLVVWLIIVGFVGYGQITNPTRFPELWLVLAAILAAGLFVLRMWFWQVRGVEIIRGYPDRIEVCKTGSFAFGRTCIYLHELDGIEASNDDTTPHWLRWWGLGGGTIVFSYLGRSFRCGQDLSIQHATRIARELNALYPDRLEER